MSFSDASVDFINMNEFQRRALLQKVQAICNEQIPHTEFRRRFAASVADIPSDGRHYSFVLRDEWHGDPEFRYGEEIFFRDIADAICSVTRAKLPSNVERTYVSYEYEGHELKYLKSFKWSLGRLSFEFHHPSMIEAVKLNTYFAWMFEMYTPEEYAQFSDADTVEGEEEDSDSDDRADWGDQTRRYYHVIENDDGR
jgi:hypothetical protein